METDRDLVAFQWTISHGTYRWVDARYRHHRDEDPGSAAIQGKRPKLRRYLETHPFTVRAARMREGDWMIRGRTWRKRSPLEDDPPGPTTTPMEVEKALFQQFADLPPKEDRILEFVKRHGHLGIDHPIDFAAGSTREARGTWTPFATGEALEDWVWEIARMRDAVTVSRKFMARDKAWLEAHFLWEKAPEASIAFQAMQQDPSLGSMAPQRGLGEVWRSTREWAKMQVLWYDSHPKLDLKKRPRGSFRFRRRLWWEFAVPELHALVKRGDLLRPAQLYVQQVINEQLRKHVGPQLLWSTPTAPAPEIRLRPSSLLGAMWLQFAKAVEGGFDYLQCERDGCRKWVRVAPQGRGRKKWCSKSCQVMAARNRKKAQDQRVN